MSLAIYPITPTFAAEIGDIDLSRPLDAETVAAIKQAFWDYGVLVFPAQELSEERHIDFAKYIGPIEPAIGAYRPGIKLRLRPDIVDVSNLNSRNEIWGEKSKVRLLNLGNRLWHTDSSFKYLPARASILYGRSIAPFGGHTEFADMRAAYDALPDAMKRRLDGMIAEHALAYSRRRTGFTLGEADMKELPPVPQMMVRTLPENGRRSLYIASHIGRIYGMDDAAAMELVDQLIAHATQRQFVYTHRWRVNDLVMWDDRCTMHRGTGFDDLRFTRDMQRATVSDIANTCEQAGVPIPAESASRAS